MANTPADVVCIDTHYVNPERMAVYMIIESGKAAFVDVGTERGCTHLMRALEERGLTPEDVEYILLTHVHLDHGAGAAQLLEHCPNATLLTHPKAARHVVAPERLVAGSKAVYGDDLFHQLYGEVKPAPEARVHAVEDGETIQWHSRELRFFYTLGHATHHLCIYDSKSKCVFTGDNFGIGRTEPQRSGPAFLVCTCTPPEFDAEEAIKSIDKIVATGADFACIAHYGIFANPRDLAPVLRRSTEKMGALVDEALALGLEGEALDSFLAPRIHAAAEEQLRACGVTDFESDKDWLTADLALNTMGVSAAVKRRRKAQVQA